LGRELRGCSPASRRRLGCPSRQLRVEAGGTTPTLPILERIANAFDTTLSVELKPKAVA
jgi:hypothetical protein